MHGAPARAPELETLLVDPEIAEHVVEPQARRDATGARRHARADHPRGEPVHRAWPGAE